MISGEGALFAPPFAPPLQGKKRKNGVIKALLRGKVCLREETKLPENWLGKPTFGEFDVELLIRFERTTCSLRVRKIWQKQFVYTMIE